MIVCGTGHRLGPNLPCKYDEEHVWAKKIIAKLTDWLKENKPSKVIVGGAIGWDMWLGETALTLKIPYAVYLPFEETGATWPQKQRDRLSRLIKNAAENKLLSIDYSHDCFFIRDEAMVDHSDTVLSLLSPNVDKGGTLYTVNYANKLKRPVINFWED